MNALQQIRARDAQRPGFPGEHWLTLAAGVGVWLASRAHPSPLVRTAGLAASSALVGRAASGRDGVRKLARWLPVGRRSR
jgi:hypothetical protein